MSAVRLLQDKVHRTVRAVAAAAEVGAHLVLHDMPLVLVPSASCRLHHVSVATLMIVEHRRMALPVETHWPARSYWAAHVVDWQNTDMGAGYKQCI